MSDLKAALTEALRAALGQLWTEPEDDADKPDWDALPGKLAGVLLALPGVAVTQLPEPIGVNGNDNRVWSHTPNYIEQEFEGDVIINDRLGIDADHLRNTAAILLAAAVLSEGETR